MLQACTSYYLKTAGKYMQFSARLYLRFTKEHSTKSWIFSVSSGTYMIISIYVPGFIDWSLKKKKYKLNHLFTTILTSLIIHSYNLVWSRKFFLWNAVRPWYEVLGYIKLIHNIVMWYGVPQRIGST